MSQRALLLRLYKDTMRNARVFPSKNRAGIVREIRAEWRKKTTIQDPEQQKAAIKAGIEGLKYLRQYTKAAEDMRTKPETSINLTGGAASSTAAPTPTHEKERWMRKQDNR